ncbi:MAG: hypothetical protein KDB61_02420, partial [Planctomycetes bacterium]|nr:hypothetical protein [Planctomycetota bacterium]
VFGFGYDGVQQFATSGAWQTGRPHARADGSFVLRWGLDTSLRSLDSAGHEQWTFSGGFNLTEPVVGPGGTTYHQVGNGGPKLHAIGINGAILWTVAGAQLGWMNFMGVSPMGGHLLDGGRAGFGQPGWIRSYSTASGELEWSLNLPRENPGSGLADLIVQSDWAFSADSSKGYVMVNSLVWDSQDGYAYLYAVDLGEPEIGSIYCGPAVPNSTGQSAAIAAFGSLSTADNDVTLVATQLPAAQFGFFLNGTAQSFVPNPGGSLGNLCVGGSLGRHNRAFEIFDSGPDGLGALALDLNSIPGPNMAASVMPGETWNFQCWYRDTVATSSNFSAAVSITFQ